MQRSLIVILLSIICGVSAAIGVNQLSPRPEKLNVETRPVYVAATSIRRGAKVGETDVKSVPWPVELIPEGVVTNMEDVVGHSALTSIVTNEPLMKSKFSEASGSGFASHTIPAGMRACSIQTNGPSASVAGFVRPGDKVDVLLNLRGNSQDDTGGGSTITLLQSAEILAIDDIMDVDAATVKMWMKEGVRSVTLLVTPEQALQLSLGQSVGTVSLALRNGDDRAFITDTHPVTINQIRSMPASDTFALQAFLEELRAASDTASNEAVGQEAGGGKESLQGPVEAIAASDTTKGSDTSSGIDTATTTRNPSTAAVASVTGQRSTGRGGGERSSQSSADAEPSRQSYIYTLRGNQPGFVRVLGTENTIP